MAHNRLLSRQRLFAPVFFSLALLLVGCASFDQFRQGLADAQAQRDAQAEQARVERDAQAERARAEADANAREEKARDDSSWGVSRLDTARSVAYLTENEKDVILEINKARSNPARYAEQYVKPLLSRFSGNDVDLPGEMTIRTNEGPRAVQECIAAMRTQVPRSALSPSRALSLAARDHVRDTGPGGIVGHRGTDGSMPSDRVHRYDAGLYAGENIDYGFQTARTVVVQLLVDDGVASRGHRENIMRPEYALIGVSVGGHKVYAWMCVIDFAANR
jgi:uncharacterized protein YkwD